ncbi:MAG: hypothetical protein GF398_01790 [Chitinivibrionales bacterium]|nr:hypothetical protein [Chitinivibrionales bacterium]
MRLFSFSPYIALLTIVSISLFSCSNSNSGSQESGIAGDWRIETDKGKIVNVEVSEDNTYKLIFKSSNLTFTGEYTLDHDNVRFVDLYCGTKLPGLYKYSRKSKNEMVIELVDDQFCSRMQFFPGTWSLIEEK